MKHQFARSTILPVGHVLVPYAVVSDLVECCGIYQFSIMSIESRIASLGLKLPSATSPLANYVPFRRTGNLLFLSGQIPKGVDESGSPLLLTGKLGQDFTVAQGQAAAKLCAINMIAQVKEACAGDLSRVRSIVKVEAFVSSTPEFKEHPQVVNGCSDLLVSVFGDDIGRHSRFAVGCSSLPLGVAVEIGAVFELAD